MTSRPPGQGKPLRRWGRSLPWRWRANVPAPGGAGFPAYYTKLVPGAPADTLKKLSTFSQNPALTARPEKRTIKGKSKSSRKGDVFLVTAVITGASSGLGKEYINAIIAEYPTVDVFWLVARRKELLKEIADEHPDKTIAAISLDLSQQESLEIFEKLLKENEPEIKVLVNNAGFGKCGDFFTSNRASQMGMVDVNCRALTAITRLCLPYMLDDSLVINVASIAAFAPTPRMSVYSATKAYVLALSKALHDELRPRGIKVLAVCPGPMDTDFWNVAGVPEGKSRLIDKLPREDPREVAEKSLRAAKRGKMVYAKSAVYKFYHVLSKVLPHGLLMEFTEV